MLSILLLLVSLQTPAAPTGPGEPAGPTAGKVAAPVLDAKDVRKQFVELAAKKEHDACLALWKANPDAVLPTIDADLEGSLKAREKSKEPNMNAIIDMQHRALWGAEIAFEASGDPMILDYASAFVGWGENQRKSFREGQAAFRSAMTALKGGDAKAALVSGQQCLDLASPLGDWWGTAMGYDAIAACQKSLGALDKALEAAGHARAIYHSLGLAGDEYQSVTAIADICVTTKRIARGKAACQIGIALAKKLGDADGEKALLAQQTELNKLAR
jgi:hypothetical protein